MTDANTFESALSPKGAKVANDQPKHLWLGFSVRGEQAEVVRKALAKVGEHTTSEYIRRLVLEDLRKRLSNEPKATPEAPEAGEDTEAPEDDATATPEAPEAPEAPEDTEGEGEDTEATFAPEAPEASTQSLTKSQRKALKRQGK